MNDPFSTDSPYVSPQAPSLAKRPASATVFGVLNLVFAALGLCGMMVTAVPFLGLEGMPEQAAAIGGIVGGVVGGCFGMAYPIILLAFMLRPRFARALQS